MKRLLLLTCIGLAAGSMVYGEDLSTGFGGDSNREEIGVLESTAEDLGQTYTMEDTSRWSGKFELWHETDKVRSSDSGKDVTDIGTALTLTDNDTGIFFRYELLTTSLTKDANERDRHNFRVGQNDMFDLFGFSVTPYYQYRYEDASEGSYTERHQHRIGYSGANDSGVSFWGYSSYDSFNGRSSELREDESGYYGEHEVLYSMDMGRGKLIPSVFNEYQSLDDSSFNNTQARLAYAHPMAEGFTLVPFTEIDLHRRGTVRENSFERGGSKDTHKRYVAGVRGNVAVSEAYSFWGEASWDAGSGDDILYLETGVAYRF